MCSLSAEQDRLPSFSHFLAQSLQIWHALVWAGGAQPWSRGAPWRLSQRGWAYGVHTHATCTYCTQVELFPDVNRDILHCLLAAPMWTSSHMISSLYMTPSVRQECVHTSCSQQGLCSAQKPFFESLTAIPGCGALVLHGCGHQAQIMMGCLQASCTSSQAACWQTAAI